MSTLALMSAILLVLSGVEKHTPTPQWHKFCWHKCLCSCWCGGRCSLWFSWCYVISITGLHKRSYSSTAVSMLLVSVDMALVCSYFLKAPFLNSWGGVDKPLALNLTLTSVLWEWYPFLANGIQSLSGDNGYAGLPCSSWTNSIDNFCNHRSMKTRHKGSENLSNWGKMIFFGQTVLHLSLPFQWSTN